MEHMSETRQITVVDHTLKLSGEELGIIRDALSEHQELARVNFNPAYARKVKAMRESLPEETS